MSELLAPTFSLESSGLRIDATTDPDDPVLEAFFSGYDRAFVLANEKEGLDGFKACLALNRPPSYAPLRASYGPFREIVFVASDPEVDAVIGGANFIAYPVRGAAGPVLCANLNYVYSNPARRRHGYLRRLVSAVEDVIDELFQRSTSAPLASDRPLIFLEQNDPLQLTPEEYAHDTAHSGIDQIDRIGIWTKLGARILDFPYVQPPLSAEQDADHTLLYAVLGAPSDQIDPRVVRQHLDRFFSISVLKGIDAASEATAAAQLTRLDQLAASNGTIPLLNPGPWLAQVRGASATDRLAGPRGGCSLRDVLRRFEGTR